MKDNVLQTIQNNMGTFSKGQRRIAQYIQNNYDKAAFMTASRLGEATQVSESTVVRFAAQLGYEGYPEMQKALQELIRGRLTSIQRIQASHEQISGREDILGTVMQRDMDALHAAIDQLDRSAFQSVVDKLMHAKRIYILGVRSSAYLAGYLHFYFHLIFPNVSLVQNVAGGEIFEQMVRIGPDDVLIGISFPRYSKQAVSAVEFARSRGATVVAITDSKVSPLYKVADTSLLVRSDMISFVDSMTVPLSLLNALIVAVGQQKHEEVSSTFSEMERVWSTYSIFGKSEDE